MNSAVPTVRAEQSEIDASAKAPVLVFFVSAVIWLLLGSLAQLAANIQLHQPAFLADCAFTTHGRLVAAAQNILVYGWGFNAAFAFGLWIMARLSATTLRHGGWLFVAAKFWNLGITLGVGGILAGYSTSFELLEMPRYVVLLLLASYALIGVWGVTTFSVRNTENVFASQWYLFGAAFWFPWLYSIAQIMLFRSPVRGVLQPIVNAWYVQGLYGLWFVPVALAAIYYFLPKILGKPISNYYLAPLAFWWLVAATALGAGVRLIGAPVPVWIPTLGIVASMMLVLPIVVIALNIFGTLKGSLGAVGGSVTLRFIAVSIAGFFLAAILGLVLSLREVAVLTQFTLLGGLRDWLVFFGCFSTAMFGAAYFFLPRLTGRGWRSPALVSVHFGATLIGFLLVAVALGLGGWKQAHLLHDASVTFATITDTLAGFHKLGSAGLALIVLGQLAFAINVLSAACPINFLGTPTVEIRNPPAMTLATKEGHA